MVIPFKNSSFFLLVFDFRFRRIPTKRETDVTTHGNLTNSAIYGLFKPALTSSSPLDIACVAGGVRERASGEAASEIPACHISYGFCLPPTFIAFDESIK